MHSEEFDLSLKKYLMISEIVQTDLNWLLDRDDNSQQWSRAFLRSSIPFIEAYCQHLREILAIAEKYGIELSTKDKKAVVDERACTTEERIKRNIRSAYIVFDVTPKPDFVCKNWEYAKEAIVKRGALMHPQSISDLEVTQEQIFKYREGVIWLCSLLFGFIEGMLKKYGDK